MLDVFDFVGDKGGDPKRIRESQRRRHAPEEAVDEVITLYEDQRKSLLKGPQRQWCFFCFHLWSNSKIRSFTDQY